MTPEIKKKAARRPLLKKKTVKSDFLNQEINEFISEMNSLRSSLPLTVSSVGVASNDALKDLNEFIDEFCTKKSSSKGEKSFEVKPKHAISYRKLRTRTDNLFAAYNTLPSSFLVTLVSKFDAFLGKLIKIGLAGRVDTIKHNEHVFSLAKLHSYDSIEDVEQWIVDSEIESLLSSRNSRNDQLKWFSDLLGNDIKKLLKNYPNFIEACERRNLYVHSDGVISTKYIMVCKSNGVKLDKKIKQGQKFKDCPVCHFREAYKDFFEAAVIISQLMWRQLFPAELVKADNLLNSICYDLILLGRDDLAGRLLDFALNDIKISDEEHKRYYVINKCIVLKRGSNKLEFKKFIDAQDWSNCNLQFQLAFAVLKDDYSSASEIMQKLGNKTDLINQYAYAEWPLFSDFRSSKEFKDAYKKIFDEEFAITAYLPRRLKVKNHEISKVANSTLSKKKKK